MSEHLAATLDLSLAWKRVKSDIQNKREFVRHPYEIILVEADLEGWLEHLRQEIRAGFNPSAPTIADIPKGRGAVRPGALLGLNDKLVYAACVGAALPAIYSSLEWSQGIVDFGYQLAKDHGKTEWLQDSFQGWSAFRSVSLDMIKDGCSHVVVTDITEFYENIDISTLISDLCQLGIDQEVVNLLSTCLNRWSIGYGRRVPQGISASDILAKVYMNSVDLSLNQLEYNHLRYVDDTRIFCLSEAKGKVALLRLMQILRRRGLNLQSAKTEILTSGKALEEFDGVIPVLRKIKDEFVRAIKEQTGVDAYLTVSQAKKLAAEYQNDDHSVDVLIDAFGRYVVSQHEKFDKTLFRFIINRLRQKKNDFCREYCINALRAHPEETGYIRNYIAAVPQLDKSFDEIYHFLKSDHAIYDYQVYQIFEWISSLSRPVPDRLKSIARHIAFDHARPAYLRAVCRQVVGWDPSISDLEQIEASYAAALGPLERAQILCDLRNLEAGRRNTFLSRARRDHALCDAAAKLIKANLLL
jgi:hypothetical protein